MPRLLLLLLWTVVATPAMAQSEPTDTSTPRKGVVRVEQRSLVDDDGPMLGLGVSYFTALHHCRHDRDRLETDLAYLSDCGFNYYRMLSMVGWYSAWEGREIAPVDFTSQKGKQIAA